MVASDLDQVAVLTINMSWKILLPMICDNINEVCASNKDVCNNVSPSEFVEMFSNIPSCSEVKVEDVNSWLQSNNVGGHSIMTDDEIIASCVAADDVDNCKLENKTGDQPEEVMTHAEATPQMEKLLAYLEWQTETTSTNLMVVKHLHDHAACKHYKKLTNLLF